MNSQANRQSERIFTHDSKTPFTAKELRQLTEMEWLVTNGLGGYASGTVGGTPTRVFHGYLIAALPTPLGRTMMLNNVLESAILPDKNEIGLNGLRREENGFVVSSALANFRLDAGLPVWTFEMDGLTIEKRIYLPHRQNTTYVNYRVASGSGSVKLHLRPAVNMREHEAPVNAKLQPYTFQVHEHRYEIQPEDGIPPLRIRLLGDAGTVAVDPQNICDVVYPLEQERGYTWRGDLWSPGYFSAEISPGHDATLVASTEAWTVMSALDPKQAWEAEHERKRRLLIIAHPDTCTKTCGDLIWAADQFLFTPVGRQEDTARARAAGDEIRSVIAGYHWFTDWGRDTMISLEGLTLVTGRSEDASYILRTFAHYIRDGLIPNMFPEGKKDGR